MPGRLASLGEYVEAFEEAHASDARADLARFVPPPGHPLRVEVIRELVRIDLEHGWLAGQPTPIDDYQRRWPELFEDTAAVREILFEDYRLRQEAIASGRQPSSPIGSGSTRVSEAANASANDAFPAPGEGFGTFRLLAELGRGAFGRVFLAEQPELANRVVVLKVAPDLFRESQTLARLQHPHVVPIHSNHVRGTMQALCMPFLGVVTLADLLGRIRAGHPWPIRGHHLLSLAQDIRASRAIDAPAPPAPPLDPDAAWHPLRDGSHVEAVLWIGACLADGLAHAHERGILHRDLKPANILLADDGRPMLLDFNLAEDLGQCPGRAHVGGTLPYMPPEQLEAFQGQPRLLDGRADVFALGAVLFELLTGHVPCPVRPGPTREVVAQLLARRRQGPVDPGAFVADLSPAVRAIIRHCLEPDPDRRYASARQLQEDLRRQLEHQPLLHVPEPSRQERLGKWMRRHPRLVSCSGLAAVALVVVLLVGGVALARGRHLARLEASETLRNLRREVPEVGLACLAGNPGDPVHLERCDERCGQLLEVLDTASLRSRLDDTERRELDEWLAQLLLLRARVRGERARLANSDAAREDLVRSAIELNDRAGDLVSPRRPSVAFQRANLLDLQSGSRAARQAYDQARLLPAEEPIDLALVADLLRREGKPREALALLDRALDGRSSAQLPGGYWAWFTRGQCQAQLDDDAGAVASFSTCLALLPDAQPALFARGMARLRRQEFGRALTDLDRVLAQAPDLLEARINRALARVGLGQTRNALNDLDVVLREPVRYTRAFFLRAQLREQLGDHAGAARDRAEGLTRRPADELSWIARAHARKDRSPGAALADLDQALALAPHSRAALQNRAHVLAERLRRLPEAIVALDRLIDLCPEDAPARAARGVLLARLGRREAALADARACLLARPDAGSIYRIGCIHALDARNDPAAQAEALRHLDWAIRLGFDKRVLRHDPDLDALTGLPEFQRLADTRPVDSPSREGRP